MDEFYLIVLARKVNDKSSKLSRVAKCSFDREATGVQNGEGRCAIGRWYNLHIYDSPFRGMLDAVFVGVSSDPGIRAAEALAERMVSGLSMASGVKWEANCGPIDAEDAALLRIELEVV
jgi:hypothetical protein